MRLIPFAIVAAFAAFLYIGAIAPALQVVDNISASLQQQHAGRK